MVHRTEKYLRIDGGSKMKIKNEKECCPRCGGRGFIKVR